MSPKKQKDKNMNRLYCCTPYPVVFLTFKTKNYLKKEKINCGLETANASGGHTLKQVLMILQYKVNCLTIDNTYNYLVNI